MSVPSSMPASKPRPRWGTASPARPTASSACPSAYSACGSFGSAALLFGCALALWGNPALDGPSRFSEATWKWILAPAGALADLVAQRLLACRMRFGAIGR